MRHCGWGEGGAKACTRLCAVGGIRTAEAGVLPTPYPGGIGAGADGGGPGGGGAAAAADRALSVRLFTYTAPKYADDGA